MGYNITEPARLILNYLLNDDHRDRIEAWAQQIARAHHRDQIMVADIKAAIMCAGEEFLPKIEEEE